jgi:REP element-mobilizing transposase RayT
MASLNKPEARQGVGTRASLPARASATDDVEESRIRRHDRGYLPHYESPELLQFVTFRLADSLPKNFIESLDAKLRDDKITEVEYFRAVERALDIGDGEKYLKDRQIARLVADAILHFAGERFELIAWVIMANHVHLLLRPIDPHTLSDIIHSIKSFTSSRANKILGRKGRFWAPEYYDRFIRDRKHFVRVKRYIDENPVKAGICALADEWPWGSAGWRD